MNEHPVVTRYMTTFDAAMTMLEAGERQAINQEIRNHIAEATAAHRSLDEVLRALGPADALARAYAVELLMHPRAQRVERRMPFFKVAALVIVGSFATLVVVTTLGAIGISFMASGFAVSAIGVLESSGIHLPGVQLSGIPPEWVIVLGVPFAAVGVAALVGLRSYIRFVAKTMRRVLPRPAVA
jgi:uncharacterized membrane protein